jgi:hypothetical protein
LAESAEQLVTELDALAAAIMAKSVSAQSPAAVKDG